MNLPICSVEVDLKTSLYFLVFRSSSKLYLISDNLQNLYLGSKNREQRTALPINTNYASRAQGDFYRVITTRTTPGNNVMVTVKKH